MKWMLAAVFLLSFGLGAAPAATGSAAAQKCLEEGKKLEKLANREGRDNQKQFEQALQKYLCAAHGGNAEGALKAAGLSGSGMATNLPDSTVITLYQQAIQSGLDSAILFFANFECGENGFVSCATPQKALPLLASAKKKGIDISFSIALILLDPSSPVSDSSRAYACNKYIGGKKWPKIRAEYLARSPHLDTTQTCEPKP